MRPQPFNGLAVAPFPEVPRSVRERFAAEPLSLRPFGISAEDREVDFTETPRPVVETQILWRCTQNGGGERPPEDFFWELEIGKRTQCLLIIAALSEKVQVLTIELRCSNPECGQELEFDFSLEELMKLHPDDTMEKGIAVKIGADEFVFRRPLGRDQLDWLNRSFSDAETAARVMAETLSVGDRKPQWESRGFGEDRMQAVNAAIAASDPLVGFQLRIECPDCGREDVHVPDLGALALGRLQGAQNRLLETIHALASRYHWTEEQILAIPPWRRSRYLSLMAREDGR